MSQKSSFLQPAPFVPRALTPDSGVRGPRDIVRHGKTPMLDPAEARQLIDAIDITTVFGLRDRPLIGLMVYSFARNRRKCARTSTPDGVLPGRSTTATGRLLSVS